MLSLRDAAAPSAGSLSAYGANEGEEPPAELRSPFLVMAHHRSGSNFLNDLLQSHPAVECINEPLSMHTRYFRDCDLKPWTGEDYDAKLLHPDLADHAELRAFLADLKSYLLQSNSHRVVGFKETVLFGKLAWLKEFLPGLKLIFLKRTVTAIVSSVLRSGLSDLWRYEELVPQAFLQLYPGYVSRISSGDVEAKAAELVAMSVVARYELASRTLGLFEHRALYLEDVMRDPAGKLREITDFLGVGPHPEPMKFLQGRQLASRGGLFSSFRAQDDVENTWRRHLNPRQVLAIDNVLFAAPRHIAEVIRE